MQKLEDRPPYVRFETRPEEDRAASVEAGCWRGRDVDYALITPMGSKDCVERIVTDWFDKIEGDVREGRCPREWLSAFREEYKAWKEGREAPINGTPIATWPPLSPSELKTLQSIHIRSVEDLAAANEEVIGRIGMGGRALKQKAVDWLEQINDNGKVAARLSAAEADNTNLREQLAEAQRQIADLTVAVKQLGGSKKL